MNCKHVLVKDFKMYCSLTETPTEPSFCCEKYEPLRPIKQNENWVIEKVYEKVSPMKHNKELCEFYNLN